MNFKKKQLVQVTVILENYKKRPVRRRVYATFGEALETLRWWVVLDEAERVFYHSIYL